MSSRPISVPPWAVYVLLFGLYLTVRGYHSRDGDQAYRLPLLLHEQDQARYADDPFVRAFDAFNPHRGYLALIDLASRPLGLSCALFSLFAATFALTCFGIDGISRRVWPGRGPWVGVVAVGLVLLAKAGNIGTNHLFEPLLLDRLIGFALGWTAISLALDSETDRPALLIGLATVIHPSIGLQLAALLGASWTVWALVPRPTRFTRRKAVLGLISLTIAVIPGALPTLGQSAQLFDGLSTGDFRSLGVELQMAQHMLPALWRMPQWLAWGAYVLLGLVSMLGPVSTSDRGTDLVARGRFVIVSLLVLAGLGAAYLGVELVRDLRLTVFQPFRMATIARGLALIAISGRCHALWTRDVFAGKMRALILAAGLATDWGFVVAATIEVLASVIDARWFTRGKLLPLALVVVVGLVFLERHDTERGHWALGLAVLAGAVIDLVGGRFQPGWTMRRLVFAATACWLVPATALVVANVGRPGQPMHDALVARCRFGAVPSDDVERLAVWARDHTPATARFVTPPGPKTFRLWSERSVVFNRAASPYHARGLKDWSDRFRDHVQFEGTTTEFARAYLADRHGLEARFARLTPRALAELAARQGADHVLAAPPDPREAGESSGPLRLLKVEGRYAIYRVEPAGSIANRREPGSVR